VCYKAGHDIEPTVLPNWFIKVDAPGKSFKRPALEVVKQGKIKIYPKWREITYIRWMEEMHDWPISRQVVWGIRIPAWYNVDDNPTLQVTFLNKDGENINGNIKELLDTYNISEIRSGLQTMIAPKDVKFKVGNESPGERYLQDTDTFDTWFSSGQWPLVTLGYPDSEDFNYFYPTSVLETGWEIIRLWVSRMVMFGLYLTGEIPFNNVYLHGLVRAIDGKKMSKSLGNVINPDEYIEKYGVDALRMGLISGTANGKDFNFPRDKIIGYRNFANKIWNMGRFMLLMFDNYKEATGTEVQFYDEKKIKKLLKEEDTDILKGLHGLIKKVTRSLEKYRFSDAAEAIYQFMWHELADSYIEKVKDREDKEIALSVFRHVYLECLKLLHPFMPFVTETIWQEMPRDSDKDLIVSTWPE
jgi:valyl-tRNA synthetase